MVVMRTHLNFLALPCISSISAFFLSASALYSSRLAAAADPSPMRSSLIAKYSAAILVWCHVQYDVVCSGSMSEILSTRNGYLAVQFGGPRTLHRALRKVGMTFKLSG